jgi:hypothetical protein
MTKALQSQIMATASPLGRIGAGSVVLSALLHAAVAAALASQLLVQPEALPEEAPIPVELVFAIDLPAEPQPERAEEPEVVEVQEPEPVEAPELIEKPEPEPVEEPEVVELSEPLPIEEPELIEEPEPAPPTEPEVAELPQPEPELQPVEVPELAELLTLEPILPPRPQRKPPPPQEVTQTRLEPLLQPVAPRPEPEEIDPTLRTAEAPTPEESEPNYTHEGEIRDVAPADLLANLNALSNEALQAERKPELWEIIRMVRSQVALCWQMDPQNPWNAKYSVDIQVAFDRKGSVKKALIKDVARMVTNDDYKSFVTEARRALMSCSPFDLPQDRFAIWRSFTLRFVPHYRS